MKMALTKLPGFSLVITLQSLLILGETFLAPDTSKDSGGLKLSEKRTNNFRVPMETPFDPNFWPARGRRSRRDPEKPARIEDCISTESFSPEKARLQCQDLREENPLGRKLEFELMPGMDSGEEVSGGGRAETDCYGNAMIPRLRDRPRGSLGFQIPDTFDAGLMDPKGLDETRHKKQKHSAQPQLILYGNGVYWEPENLFGEKKKKQDVFWVARGKKNFQNL